MTPNVLIGNRIIVKPIAAKEEKKKSGIIIPETANANLSEGIVVMIDEALKDVISVGDTAIFPTGSGVGQYLNGEPHLWLKVDNEVWGFERKSVSNGL